MWQTLIQQHPGHAVEFGQISMLLSRGADCKIYTNSQNSWFGQLGRLLANPQMGGLSTGSPSTGIPTLSLISWVQKNIWAYKILFDILVLLPCPPVGCFGWIHPCALGCTDCGNVAFPIWRTCFFYFLKAG